MLLPTIFLLASLGQARSLVSRQDVPGAIRVNGTITSFSVLEGSGCPAGTFEPQPIEPGKTINTYVDFDSFVYDSDVNTEPLTCTLSIDFEFKYPESGTAEVLVSTIGSIEGRYKEGDEDPQTVFPLGHYITASAGNEDIEGPLSYILLVEGTADLEIAAALYPVGAPGEVGTGSLRTDFDIRTDLGPGVMTVHRIAIGFGLGEQPVDNQIAKVVEK